MVFVYRDLGLLLATVLTGALCMVQFELHNGALAQTLLPIIALGLIFLLPRLINLGLFNVIVAFAFLTVFCDESYNTPFYEGNPISEMLGPLLFDRWHELLGVNWLRITGFEVISLVLAVMCLLKLSIDLRFRTFTAGDRILRLMVLVFPLTVGLAVLYGVMNGNSLSIAMTQNRFMPVISIWILFGYVAYQRPAQAEFLILMLAVASILKCLEGWYVFIFDFGFKLESREYLMEHVTSEPIAMTMMYVGYLWWHRRTHFLHDVAALGLELLMAGPYLLNLRRTSFLGLGFTLLLIPLLYWRGVRKRHILFGISSVLIAASVVIATWNLPPPLGSLSYPLRRFTNPNPPGELDYRDVENFNHYHSIIDAPLLGRGFGVTLARYIPLLDISTVYALYETVPHNNLLFLWANGGPITVGAFAALAAFGFAIFLRLNRVSLEMGERLLGFLGWGMVLRWLFYVYADLGLAFFRLPAILGLAIGMALRAIDQRRGGAREVTSI